LRERYHLSFANAPAGAAGAGILPVPYDRTASYAAGARNGPDAILLASRQLEAYDEVLGFEPAEVGVATLEPLPSQADGPKAMLASVRDAVAELLRDGVLPVVLGGDHAVTIGAVEAIAAASPGVGVLQLDAHADMRDAYEGSRVSHACVMRRVRERVPAVSVGIRSYSLEEAEYMRGAGVRVHEPADVRAGASLTPILDVLPPEVYVTFDVDAFDPSIMPATGTPEPGGLTWADADAVLAWVAEHRRIVGFDVVELAPIPAFHAPDYMIARLVHRMIGRAFRSRS